MVNDNELMTRHGQMLTVLKVPKRASEIVAVDNPFNQFDLAVHEEFLSEPFVSPSVMPIPCKYSLASVM